MKVQGLLGYTRQCHNCGKLTTIKTGLYINSKWFCKASCHNEYGKKGQVYVTPTPSIDCATDVIPISKRTRDTPTEADDSSEGGDM